MKNANCWIRMLYSLPFDYCTLTWAKLSLGCITRGHCNLAAWSNRSIEPYALGVGENVFVNSSFNILLLLNLGKLCQNPAENFVSHFLPHI